MEFPLEINRRSLRFNPIYEEVEIEPKGNVVGLYKSH